MTGNLDIIVYALVAAILLVRLWTVFGRRNDDERQRPNPFAAPAPGTDDDDAPFRLSGSRSDDDAGFPLGQPALLAPMSLMSSLEQVKQLDPNFDEKQFLQTARATFTSVIENFAKGDLSGVKQLLGPAVLAGFQSAIDARAKSGEVLETRIGRIADAETTAARVEGDSAFITVRFMSEQENILRNAAGDILRGAVGNAEEITDLWTFAREVKTAGSDWQLVETRS